MERYKKEAIQTAYKYSVIDKLVPIPTTILNISSSHYIDVNECLESKDICDKNAVCIDTPESYECRCKAGYHKDTGKECVKGIASHNLLSLRDVFDKINFKVLNLRVRY